MKTKTECAASECDRESSIRDLCSKHYRKALRSGEISAAEKVDHPVICIAEGCDRTSEKRGMCSMHYRRMQRFGTFETTRQKPGSLMIRSDGYHSRRVDGKETLEHVNICQKILGLKLPKGVEVHHVNGDRGDNKNTNLVVCQDRGYHMILHARQRALDSCGNANFKLCTFCSKYDDPFIMKSTSSRGNPNKIFYHSECARERQINSVKNRKIKNSQ